MKQLVVEYVVRTIAGVPSESGLPYVRFITSTFVADDNTALPPLSSIVPEARKHAWQLDNVERIDEGDLYVERYAIL